MAPTANRAPRHQRGTSARLVRVAFAVAVSIVAVRYVATWKLPGLRLDFLGFAGESLNNLRNVLR